MPFVNIRLVEGRSQKHITLERADVLGLLQM
jgi:hypothetical protein